MNAEQLWEELYGHKCLSPSRGCRGFMIDFAEAYHRAKVEAVTDEEIEKGLNDLAYEVGAKWLRDKLLNQ